MTGVPILMLSCALQKRMHLRTSTLDKYFIKQSAERGAEHKNHLINIKPQNAKGHFYACVR